MGLIYRTWLIVREAERRLPKTVDDEYPSSKELLEYLIEKKSFFGLGKKYGTEKAIKAKLYAQECKYLIEYNIAKDKKGNSITTVEVGPNGFLFSTPIGFIDKTMQTFGWILQFASILISLAALYISILSIKG